VAPAGNQSENRENKRDPKLTKKPIYSTCGRARSFNSTGGNPVPARQASHREESLGPAGVIPKVKHRVIELTGRKRKAEVIEPRNLKCEGRRL
jgi:hypothetical protein